MNRAIGFGITALSVSLSVGCLKDKYAYDTNNDAQEDMGGVTEEMGVKPTGECATAQDCPALSNAQARCDAQKTCAYTCAQGWGDPEGKIATQGCTCDKATSSCEPTSTCGDGFKEGTEQCDDGPQNSDSSPDACRTSCQPASCGDGVVDTGELCDDGNQDNTDACTTQCSPCGNGKLDEGERCDDGNSDDGDGCSSACAVEELWACDETTSPSQCWEEWSPPADRPFMKGYGQAMALSNNIAAIAAPEDETYFTKGGSVQIYEFKNDQWQHKQELKPDDEVAENSQFGASLAITDLDEIIVSTRGKTDNNSSNIYIFKRNTQGNWEKSARINGPEFGLESLGEEISYDNNILAVANPRHNSNRGSLYIFQRNNPNLNFWLKYKHFGELPSEEMGTNVKVINTNQTSTVFYTSKKPDPNNPTSSNKLSQVQFFPLEFLSTKPSNLITSQETNTAWGSFGFCASNDTITYTSSKYKEPNVSHTEIETYDHFFSKKNTQTITSFDLSGSNFENDLIAANPNLPNSKTHIISIQCQSDTMSIYSPNINNQRGEGFIYKKSGSSWAKTNTPKTIEIPQKYNLTPLQKTINTTSYKNITTTDGKHMLLRLLEIRDPFANQQSEPRVFPFRLQ